MNHRFVCPKCGAASGDDWSQCGKLCPVPGSPYYDSKRLDMLTESDLKVILRSPILCSHCEKPLVGHDQPPHMEWPAYTSWNHQNGQLMCEPNNPDNHDEAEPKKEDHK